MAEESNINNNLSDNSVGDDKPKTPSSKNGSTASKIKEAGLNKVTENSPESVKKVAETTKKTVDIAKKMKDVYIAFQNFISAFVATVLDPIFWIVFGVILALILSFIVIIGSVQVIGQNENSDGCVANSDGSNSGIQANDSKDSQKNAESVANWLMTNNFKFLGNKGMTKNQAAGVIGNMWLESSVIPTTSQANFLNGKDTSNDDIINMGGVGGRAVGLIQWDADRRTKLAQYAKEHNAKWSDINIQLEFLKKEIDEYYGAALASAGFNDTSKSAHDYVEIFERKVESAGVPAMEKRFAYADNFLKNYSGNGGNYDGGSTGGSCLMDNNAGNGDYDTSDAIKLAISIAYPTEDESWVKSDISGQDVATAGYKKAKAEAQKKAGADPQPNLYASCDRFVATVIKLTMDKDIPWGSTTEQGNYLAKSKKWKQYTKKSEAKPGDIWVTRTNGHIILYIGKYKGKDSIASASYTQRVGAIGPASYLNDNLVDQSGRPYYGYHFVG